MIHVVMMEMNEKRKSRSSVRLSPSGKVPSPASDLIGAIQASDNTVGDSRNGLSTATITATTRSVTNPVRTTRSTNEMTPTVALIGSANGTSTTANHTAVSSPQTAVANAGSSTQPAHSLKDTQTREFLSKRERLLSLNIQASKKIALNVHEKFPEEYDEHVHRLSVYFSLKAKSSPELREVGYIPLVPCMGKRIDPSDKTNTLVPYVHVLGLRTEHAIKVANAILSKSEVRSLYHPHIRICFDLSRVGASASDEASIVYGTPSETLCGAIAVIKHDNIARKVTIGGLISVGNKFYAITTSHVVPIDSKEPSRASSSTLEDLIIDESDYDDDIEPALVIEREIGESSSLDENSSSTLDNNGPPLGLDSMSSRKLGTLEIHGPEWSLIRIQDPHMQLPNFAVVGDDSTTVAWNAHTNRSYISSVSQAPSGTAVTVLAGRSGQVQARLSPNKAYTQLPLGDSVETWTLTFPDNTGLRKGDSGSWVVDHTSGVLYGHVFAISKGFAFIRPMKDIFREISSTPKFKTVQMPTPFDLLAELSKLDSKRLLPLQAAKFARQAIATNALQHSAQSASAKLIQGFLRKQLLLGENTMFILCKVLQTTGADLLGALRGSTIWELARDEKFGEVGMALQFLKDLSGEADIDCSPHKSNLIVSEVKGEPAGSLPNKITFRNPTQSSPSEIELVSVPYTRWAENQETLAARIQPLPHSKKKTFLEPPFSENMFHYLSMSPKDSLPTIAGRDHRINFATDSMAEFLKEDLDLSRLNRIQDDLWIAAKSTRAQSLHSYKTMGLDIKYTQQMDLHLLKTRSYLLLKPLPGWIFSYEFWLDLICQDKDLHESACGFLMSYVWLLNTPIDLKLAHDLALLPERITWGWWRDLVQQFLNRVDINTRHQVNERYHFGDLRLDRINLIYRTRFITTHLMRGYSDHADDSVTFFQRSDIWIVIGFVVILSAMQVGTNLQGLEDNRAFQRASYGFVVFSLVSIAALLAMGGFVYLMLSLYNLWAAFRKSMIEQKVWHKIAQQKRTGKSV